MLKAATIARARKNVLKLYAALNRLLGHPQNFHSHDPALDAHIKRANRLLHQIRRGDD